MEVDGVRRDPESREHRFSFGDCCLAVLERYPRDYEGSTVQSQRQTLFFLHGRYGQGDTWEPLAMRLARQYHCFQIDLPGFGRSYSIGGGGHSILEQSRMIEALVERFASGKCRAVLIGHDVGGAIAQLCAIHAPEVVSALVLINSSTLTRAPGNLRAGWSCNRARRLLRKLLGRGRVPSQYQELLLDCWRDRLHRIPMMHAFKAWERTWPGPLDYQLWREKLSKLPHPVLLLWGRDDPINPREHAEELLRQFPDAYFFEEESSGHWLALENQEWVHAKMLEFLFQVGESQPVLRLLRA